MKLAMRSVGADDDHERREPSPSVGSLHCASITPYIRQCCQGKSIRHSALSFLSVSGGRARTAYLRYLSGLSRIENRDIGADP